MSLPFIKIEEAVKKTCPFMPHTSAAQPCIGDACMKWEGSLESKHGGVGSVQGNIHSKTHGRCAA